MKKPITKYNDGNKAKTWIISISLQLWAMLITFFTGREITHAFYYSEIQNKRSRDMRYMVSYDHPFNNSVPIFKRKEYTEMRELKYGWSNWLDAKLLGLGSDNDIDWSEYKKKQ